MGGPGVTDHALTPGDPRSTIHFAIGRAIARWRGFDQPFVGVDGDSVLAWSASLDDPDSRRSYAYQVIFAWLVLAIAFGLAMAVVGVPIKELLSDSAGNVVIEALGAAGFFCCAGSVNVMWRMYYFIPVAERLARQGETSGAAYAAAMRRTLPRNSSLLFQTAVGIGSFILMLSNW
jgi:hypothetical protein